MSDFSSRRGSSRRDGAKEVVLMTTSVSLHSAPGQVFTIGLPLDSRIPRRRKRTRGGDSPPAETITRRRRVLPASADRPASAEENDVWFRWVVGHQHLFLYWMVQADLCERTSRALE